MSIYNQRWPQNKCLLCRFESLIVIYPTTSRSITSHPQPLITLLVTDYIIPLPHPSLNVLHINVEAHARHGGLEVTHTFPLWDCLVVLWLETEKEVERMWKKTFIYLGILSQRTKPVGLACLFPQIAKKVYYIPGSSDFNTTPILDLWCPLSLTYFC